MRPCHYDKTFRVLFAWNCSQSTLLISQVMNGTGLAGSLSQKPLG